MFGGTGSAAAGAIHGPVGDWRFGVSFRAGAPRGTSHPVARTSSLSTPGVDRAFGECFWLGDRIERVALRSQLGFSSTINSRNDHETFHVACVRVGGVARRGPWVCG